MNVAHLLDEVRAYLAAYPDGQPDVAELLLQIESNPEGILLRSTMAGHVTSSALVLSPDLQSALLIDHKALGVRIQPGGHHEPGLSLLDNAGLEVAQETGQKKLRPFVTHPINVDTHPIPANPRKGEGAHRHHDFLYLLIADGAEELVGKEDEVDGVLWSPLDQLAEQGGHLGRAATRAIVLTTGKI